MLGSAWVLDLWGVLLEMACEVPPYPTPTRSRLLLLLLGIHDAPHSAVGPSEAGERRTKLPGGGGRGMGVGEGVRGCRVRCKDVSATPTLVLGAFACCDVNPIRVCVSSVGTGQAP